MRTMTGLIICMLFTMTLIPDILAGKEEDSKALSTETQGRSGEELKRAKEEAMKFIKEAETIAKVPEGQIQNASMKPAEDEKTKTPLGRLALAEKEVADVYSIYSSLEDKVTKLKKSEALLQGQYKNLENLAIGLEKQSQSAKDTKDRAEGQYKPTKYKAGIRKPLSERER